MKRQLTKARYPLIVALIAASVVLFVQISAINAARARAMYPELTPGDLAVALLRVGLDPESLAAAGLSSGDTTSLVGDIVEWLVPNEVALETADAAFAQARRTRDSLRRIVQSGTATPQQVADFSAAQSAFAQAQADRQAQLDAMVAAGTAGLTQAELDTLTTIRGNGAWDLPTEFLAVNRAESEWVQIRGYLANERISEAAGETPDAEAQAALVQFRADPAVALAKANLDPESRGRPGGLGRRRRAGRLRPCDPITTPCIRTPAPIERPFTGGRP